MLAQIIIIITIIKAMIKIIIIKALTIVNNCMMFNKYTKMIIILIITMMITMMITMQTTEKESVKIKTEREIEVSARTAMAAMAEEETKY